MARDQAHRADAIVGPSAFRVPPAVRRAMVDHARRARPIECCGLLVGRGAEVTAAVPMDNVEASPTRFRIDDRQHILLRRAVRLVSPPLQILGVYHSHPSSPARPSPTDVAEAFYPDWVYVVIGFAGDRPRVRGFSIVAGRVRPVRLRGIDGNVDDP